jgi:hypothetical protein
MDMDKSGYETATRGEPGPGEQRNPLRKSGTVFGPPGKRMAGLSRANALAQSENRILCSTNKDGSGEVSCGSPSLV